LIPAGLEASAERIAAAEPRRWIKLRITNELSAHAQRVAHRLNSLGSLFTFAYVTLGYDRLTPALHGQICSELEQEHLRLVMELPRDHFKTTTGTIARPMWRSLPFTDDDEAHMRALGYDESWIRWMRVAHNTCRRTLIASETGPNTKKMGDKIEHHYKSNALFRFLFPEIIPRGTERWNQDSMIHNRLSDGNAGNSEGTYDLISAGAALQSNHYEDICEDDCVGEDAIKSDSVMQGLIGWHDRLPGAFDSIPGKPDQLGDQLVNANRWSERDLNAHIRATDKTFSFITHDAEGGCCALHPVHGQPIFPEEFSMKKLAFIRAIEGEYNYSCHYRNNPIAPEAVRFKASWLRYYTKSVWELGLPTNRNTANYSQLSSEMRRVSIEAIDAVSSAPPRHLNTAMEHEVYDGVALGPVFARDMDRIMLVDPNHSGEYGRSRNAILVIGIYMERGKPQRIYLLDAWARACGHEEWIDRCIGQRENNLGLAFKWKVSRVYGEFGVAGQAGWKYLFQEKIRNLITNGEIKKCFTVHPLKTDRSENAKTSRIIGMESIYENGIWWMPRSTDGGKLFLEEYERYPNGSTIDLLDLAGYAPQTFGISTSAQQRDFLKVQRERHMRAVANVGPAGI
jgi:hypothetical protein